MYDIRSMPMISTSTFKIFLICKNGWLEDFSIIKYEALVRSNLSLVKNYVQNKTKNLYLNTKNINK